MFGWVLPTVTGVALLVFALGARSFLRAPSRRSRTVILLGGGAFALPWLLLLVSALLNPFLGKG